VNGSNPASSNIQPPAFDLMQSSAGNISLTLPPGGWLGVLSLNISAAHLLFNVGGSSLEVTLSNPVPRINLTNNSWISVSASVADLRALPPHMPSYEASLYSVGVPVDRNLCDVKSLLALRQYMTDVPGFELLRGTVGSAAAAHGLKVLELEIDSATYVAEVRVSKPATNEGLTDVAALILPLRLGGLNRRWSVGVLQLSGYCVGHYGVCGYRYRSLGVDDHNRIHVPVYPGRANVTHLLMGHPVIAVGDPKAQRLFIQVTAIGSSSAADTNLVNVSTVSGSMRWHVSIQNPESHPITARFEAQGFGTGAPPQTWNSQTALTVPAGGTLVLS
jgi:hypothetical protein